MLTYWHEGRKEFIVGEFMAPDAPAVGELLRLNQPVESVAEAVAKCRGRLRAKNRAEVKADITLVGDTRRRAMEVVAVKGFGVFDADYFVDTATHRIDSSGGYTTALEARRVLGY